MGDGDGDAVDDDTVVGVEGVFHATTDNVVAAEDKGVEYNSAENYRGDKGDETEGVF